MPKKIAEPGVGTGNHSKHARGEAAALSKLTEEQVLAIREETGSLRQIAAKYDTTAMNVRAIRKRLTWRHI